MSGKFHRAARDGLIDLLKSANKRELNSPDEDGMTPVHWAAYSGNLEALRVTIGRGGDTDKADLWGSTALHFAARNKHMNCLSFLVNYGSNIWSMDNDGHSALDIAGLKGQTEIVKYLDAEMGRQSTLNPKEVQKKKQKALVEAEKRMKKWQKLTNKNKENSKEEFPLEEKFKQTLRFGTREPKSNPATCSRSYSDFVLDARTTRSVASRPPTGNNSQTIAPNVIYANPREEIGADSGISGDMSPEAPSLFERPGFGTVCFRSTELRETLVNLESPTTTTGNGEDPDSLSDGLVNHRSSLQTFLRAHNLHNYWHRFNSEKITLESLMLLSDSDLQALQIPLGPRRLLLDAISARQKALNQPFRVHTDVRM